MGDKAVQAGFVPVQRSALVSRSSEQRVALQPSATTVRLILTVVLFSTAVYAIHALLRQISYEQVIGALGLVSGSSVGLSLLATTASFAALVGYDWSALSYVGARVPLRLAALASFFAYSLGNAVGLGVLTGGSVRYRLYSSVGVPFADIARIAVFCALAFGAGITVVAGGALALYPDALTIVAGLDPLLARIIGIAILTLGTLFTALCYWHRQPLALGRWRLRLPAGSTALGQLIISCVDIACAGAAFYVFLPAGAMQFGPFLAIYSIALVAGVISHVPGGLGVFEAVILISLGHEIPREALTAALIAYRAIYNLLPLAATATLLAASAFLKSPSEGLNPSLAQRVGQLGSRLVPSLMAVLVFAAGATLLISGATPIGDIRIEVLRDLAPLSVAEVSHFLGSIVALVLLILASGLYRRLSAAYWLIVVMLLAGIVLSLARGAAIGEAFLLVLLLAVLLSSRREFYRPSSLLDQTLSPRWWLALATTVGGITWLTYFAFRDTQYSHELWWQFAFESQAPRSMRTTLGVVVAAVAIGLVQLLRPAPPRIGRPAGADLECARSIIRDQNQADANLALIGDKSFLFAPDRKAFLMFGVRGRSWVALGDPVGPKGAWVDLIWRFREMCDRHGGRAAFYQVRSHHLSLYLDTGLIPFKLGEEARIRLPTFTLAGAERSKLRYALKRGERDGLTFELHPPGQIRSYATELAAVSDAWLERHNTREKQFSLGAFTIDYVDRFDIAIVRQNGRIAAFATIFTTDTKQEAAIDLMRHISGASPHLMEFLIISLLRQYQSAGFRFFSLGMAPLAGLDSHPLAPRWHRLGRWLYSHGEQFYNFQGLRQFKEKFDPIWEPRYLAIQRGPNPLIVAMDVAALIAGSLKGVVAR